jgi:small subunit ribosomal protein S15
MLDQKKKQSIIKKFQTHQGDTGSSEVQIAILTTEIEELIEHLKQHPKDHSSRRGLLRKVSSRRNLLRYLKKENSKSYEEIIKKLKIKAARVITKPGQENQEQAEDDVLEEDIDLKEHEPNS